ncbi:hypothetical protein Fleli_2063 [Bernardetia litoralis DSM 6794]|uniref:Uncharacterized protein n=1 Tax=Bernardetia litoralis (strain ATCC 23117 / DSM 6794 / NBRC 15988 / NCIMB 1366 / Fx l1 / Sio-4) TaxID=880071 RepID=I4AKG1_BERLS|nr:hypothetical protein [Bernardetia litoralis]AFM04446.1 hypothetical protein Fleli_2063 [Bernardetia litoralis DSM 6794]
MKTHNDNLNRLKAVTPLLQTLLSEFQEEIDHLLKDDDKNLISDNEVFQRLLERRASKYRTLSNRRMPPSGSRIAYRYKKATNNLYVRLKYNDANNSSESYEEKVNAFFRESKELVDTVLFKEQTYYIALKEDSTKNRNLVFDFLEKHEQETQHSFLVQFIPLSFINKFNHFQKISLD